MPKLRKKKSNIIEAQSSEVNKTQRKKIRRRPARKASKKLSNSDVKCKRKPAKVVSRPNSGDGSGKKAKPPRKPSRKPPRRKRKRGKKESASANQKYIPKDNTNTQERSNLLGECSSASVGVSSVQENRTPTKVTVPIPKRVARASPRLKPQVKESSCPPDVKMPRIPRYKIKKGNVVVKPGKNRRKKFRRVMEKNNMAVTSNLITIVTDLNQGDLQKTDVNRIMSLQLGTPNVKSTLKREASFLVSVPTKANNEDNTSEATTQDSTLQDDTSLGKTEETALKDSPPLLQSSNSDESISGENLYSTLEAEEVGKDLFDIVKSQAVANNDYPAADDDSPWITETIRNEIQKRDLVYKLAMNTQKKNLKSFYNRIKRKVNFMVRNAKERHFKIHTEKEITNVENPKGTGNAKGKRPFTNIVIITDDRKDKKDLKLCEELREKFSFLSFISVAKIGYHNAFETIVQHKSYGKGTLFIMLCGLATVLIFQNEKSCRHRGAPLRRLLLPSKVTPILRPLKRFAKSLKDDVEANGVDKIIFTGLFPVHLQKYDSYIIKRHLNACGHIVHAYSDDDYRQQYNALSKAVGIFNRWLQDERLAAGFDHWSVELPLVHYLDDKMIFKAIHCEDGVNLSKTHYCKWKDAVSDALQKTLGQIDIISDIEKMNCTGAESHESDPSAALGSCSGESTSADKYWLHQTQENEKNSGSERLHIVLVFDEQDSYLQSFEKPDVTCIYQKDFSLLDSQIFDAIVVPEDQNTLFVILGGIKTVVKEIVESECLDHQCRPELLRINPTLVDSEGILKELVSAALVLRKSIINNTPKRHVIFSGLLPPSLYRIDKYAVDTHESRCGHKAPLHSKDYFAAMNSVLSGALVRYNTWAYNDAIAKGFPGWNIEKIFVSENDCDVCYNHVIELDGRSLNMISQEDRRNTIEDVIEYTRSIAVPEVSAIRGQDLKFHPDEISLVLDERDDFLTSIKMPQVSFINTVRHHVCYDEIHDNIKSATLDGKNVLYVVLGGIETALRYRDEIQCKSLGCHFILKRVELVSITVGGLHNTLVSKALSLRKEIDNGCNQRKVIFGQLLPLDLMVIEEHAISEHMRHCNHEIKYFSRDCLSKQTKILSSAVNTFNAWARKDAVKQGFHSWNVDEMFAGIPFKSDVLFLPSTSANGCYLLEKWQTFKISSVCRSITETFRAVEEAKNGKEGVQSSSSGPSNVPIVERRLSANGMEQSPFKHVVIICNTLYSHLLTQISSPQVTVLAEQQLNLFRIPELVEQHRLKRKENTIWLLPTGIYSLTDFFPYPGCGHYQCTQPLHILTNGKSKLSRNEMLKDVKEIIDSVKLMHEDVKKKLGPGDVVLFLPPIRALIVVIQMFHSHKSLHQACEMNSAFCTDMETIEVLKEYYNIFAEAWQELLEVECNQNALPSVSIFSQYLEGNKGQNVIPITDDEDYTFATNMWIDMLRTFISASIPYHKVVSRHLEQKKDFPAAIDYNKNPSICTILHVVIIGEKHLFTELKLLLKEEIVTFIEDRIDFTEASARRFLEYQKKWKRNTLILLLTSVSQLTAVSGERTHCAHQKCEDPITYHVLRAHVTGNYRNQEKELEYMVNNEISRVRNFVSKVSPKLGFDTILCLLPIVPMMAMLTSSNTLHNRIHVMKEAEPGLQVLQGNYFCWSKCASYFEKKWKQMLLKNITIPEVRQAMNRYYNVDFKSLNFFYNIFTMQRDAKIFSSSWNKMVLQVLQSVAPGLEIYKATFLNVPTNLSASASSTDPIQEMPRTSSSLSTGVQEISRPSPTSSPEILEILEIPRSLPDKSSQVQQHEVPRPLPTSSLEVPVDVTSEFSTKRSAEKQEEIQNSSLKLHQEIPGTAGVQKSSSNEDCKEASSSSTPSEIDTKTQIIRLSSKAVLPHDEQGNLTLEAEKVKQEIGSLIKADPSSDVSHGKTLPSSAIKLEKIKSEPDSNASITVSSSSSITENSPKQASSSSEILLLNEFDKDARPPPSSASLSSEFVLFTDLELSYHGASPLEASETTAKLALSKVGSSTITGTSSRTNENIEAASQIPTSSDGKEKALDRKSSTSSKSNKEERKATKDKECGVSSKKRKDVATAHEESCASVKSNTAIISSDTITSTEKGEVSSNKKHSEVTKSKKDNIAKKDADCKRNTRSKDVNVIAKNDGDAKRKTRSFKEVDVAKEGATKKYPTRSKKESSNVAGKEPDAKSKKTEKTPNSKIDKDVKKEVEDKSPQGNSKNDGFKTDADGKGNLEIKKETDDIAKKGVAKDTGTAKRKLETDDNAQEDVGARRTTRSKMSKNCEVSKKDSSAKSKSAVDDVTKEVCKSKSKTTASEVTKKDPTAKSPSKGKNAADVAKKNPDTKGPCKGKNAADDDAKKDPDTEGPMKGKNAVDDVAKKDPDAKGPSKGKNAADDAKKNPNTKGPMKGKNAVDDVAKKDPDAKGPSKGKNVADDAKKDPDTNGPSKGKNAADDAKKNPNTKGPIKGKNAADDVAKKDPDVKGPSKGKNAADDAKKDPDTNGPSKGKNAADDVAKKDPDAKGPSKSKNATDDAKKDPDTKGPSKCKNAADDAKKNPNTKGPIKGKNAADDVAKKDPDVKGPSKGKNAADDAKKDPDTNGPSKGKNAADDAKKNPNTKGPIKGKNAADDVAKKDPDVKGPSKGKNAADDAKKNPNTKGPSKGKNAADDVAKKDPDAKGPSKSKNAADEAKKDPDTKGPSKSKNAADDAKKNPNTKGPIKGKNAADDVAKKDPDAKGPSKGKNTADNVAKKDPDVKGTTDDIEAVTNLAKDIPESKKEKLSTDATTSSLSKNENQDTDIIASSKKEKLGTDITPSSKNEKKKGTDVTSPSKNQDEEKLGTNITPSSKNKNEKKLCSDITPSKNKNKKPCSDIMPSSNKNEKKEGTNIISSSKNEAEKKKSSDVMSPSKNKDEKKLGKAVTPSSKNKDEKKPCSDITPSKNKNEKKQSTDITPSSKNKDEKKPCSGITNSSKDKNEKKQSTDIIPSSKNKDKKEVTEVATPANTSAVKITVKCKKDLFTTTENTDRSRKDSSATIKDFDTLHKSNSNQSRVIPTPKVQCDVTNTDSPHTEESCNTYRSKDLLASLSMDIEIESTSAATSSSSKTAAATSSSSKTAAAPSSSSKTAAASSSSSETAAAPSSSSETAAATSASSKTAAATSASSKTAAAISASSKASVTCTVAPLTVSDHASVSVAPGGSTSCKSVTDTRCIPQVSPIQNASQSKMDIAAYPKLPTLRIVIPLKEKLPDNTCLQSVEGHSTSVKPQTESSGPQTRAPTPTCVVLPNQVINKDKAGPSSHPPTAVVNKSLVKVSSSATSTSVEESSKMILAGKKHYNPSATLCKGSDGIPTAVVTPSQVHVPSKEMQSTAQTVLTSEDSNQLRSRSRSNASQQTYGVLLMHLSTSISNEKMKQLIEVCGPVQSFGRPVNILGKQAEHMWVKFMGLDDAVKARQLFDSINIEGNPIEAKSMGDYSDGKEPVSFDLRLYKKLKGISVKSKLKICLKEGISLLSGNEVNEASTADGFDQSDDDLSLSSISISSEDPLPDDLALDSTSRRPDPRSNKSKNKSEKMSKSLKTVSKMAKSGEATVKSKEISKVHESTNIKPEPHGSKSENNAENVSKISKTVNKIDKSREAIVNKTKNERKNITVNSDDENEPRFSGVGDILLQMRVAPKDYSAAPPPAKTIDQTNQKGEVKTVLPGYLQETKTSGGRKRKSRASVIAWNFSKVVPLEIVDKLFIACGAFDDGTTLGASGKKIYRFAAYKDALIAKRLLKDLRFVDTILKAEIEDSPNEEKPKVTVAERMTVQRHFNRVLNVYEGTFVKAAKSFLEKGISIYNFKTDPCTKAECSAPDLCHDYHGKNDQRRNPILYSYSKDMCCMMQQKGDCSRKENCEEAHSPLEMLFHHQKFRNHACPGWAQNRTCFMKDKICPFVHPESPDMFFHSSWQDLYVEGLHNTFRYLSGALMNYFRLHLSGQGDTHRKNVHLAIAHIRILVVTPSTDMAKLIAQTVKDLAIHCHTDVDYVSNSGFVPDTNVVIGSPSVLNKMLEDAGPRSPKDEEGETFWHENNLQAIIIDDFSILLGEFSKYDHKHLELKQLLSTKDANKVVVCEEIDVGEMYKARRLLDTKLIRIHTKVPEKDNEVNTTSEPNLSELQVLLLGRNRRTVFCTSKEKGKEACGKSVGEIHKAKKKQAYVRSSNYTDELCFPQPEELGTFGRKPSLDSTEEPVASQSYHSSASMYSSHEEIISNSESKGREGREFAQSSSSWAHPLSRSVSPTENYSSSSRAKHERHTARHLRDDSPIFRSGRLSEERQRSVSPIEEARDKRRKKSSSSRSRDSSPAFRSHRFSEESTRSVSPIEEFSDKRHKKSSSSKRRSHSPEKSPERKRHKHHKHRKSCKHYKESKSGSDKKQTCKKYKCHKIQPSEAHRETDLASILLTPKNSGKSQNVSSDEDIMIIEEKVTPQSSSLGKRSSSSEMLPLPSPKKHRSSDTTKEQQRGHPHNKKKSTEDLIVLLEDVGDDITLPAHQKSSAQYQSIGPSGSSSSSSPKKKSASSQKTSTSPCKKCFGKLDPATDEEFLTLEETSKKEHSLEYQIYVDAPEIHPEYSGSRAMFDEYYEQKYGSESDSTHREIIWENFWTELIQDKEKEDWEAKRECLVKQCEMDREKNVQCTCPRDSESPILIDCDGRISPWEAESPEIDLTDRPRHNSASRSNISRPDLDISKLQSMTPQSATPSIPPPPKLNSVLPSMASHSASRSVPPPPQLQSVMPSKTSHSATRSVPPAPKLQSVMLSKTSHSATRSVPPAPKIQSVMPSMTSHSASRSVTLPPQLQSILPSMASHSATRSVPPTPQLQSVLPSMSSRTATPSIPHASKDNPNLDIPLLEALMVLSEVCESLGEFFGSIMKKVLTKVGAFKDPKEAFRFLGEEDTIKFLRMVSEKMKKASEVATGPQKSKLTYCCVVVDKLISFTSGSVPVTRKENSMRRLDIADLAKATLNKDTTMIVEMIKRTLISHGMSDPSHEAIYKVYSEITSWHLKALLGKQQK